MKLDHGENTLKPAIQPAELRRSRYLRLSVLVGALAIASAIVGTITVLSLELRQQALDNARERVASLSRITAERTSQTFMTANRLVRSIRDLSIKSGLPDADALRARCRTVEFQSSLGVLHTLLPRLEIAGIVDGDGQVIADGTVLQSPRRLDLSNTDLFQTLRQHPEQDLKLGSDLQGAFNGRRMLLLALPIPDDAGRFAGMAVVGVTLDYFEQYFSTIEVGPDSSVALVSDDARMIARWPIREDAIGMRLGGASPPPLAPGGVARIATVIGIDGERRLVADTRLQVPGVAMHIAVTQSERAILDAWRGMAMGIGGSALIAVIAICALTAILLRWISQDRSWRIATLEREGLLSLQAAELTVARDDAEQAQRSRGEFLANMSHELRTPLNAVLGFSDIIRSEMLGPIGNGRYREFAKDIHDSGQHLLDIINNLLDLTKIDTGKFALFEEDVDVADLMRFCVKQIAESARAGGINLDVRSQTEGLTLRADPIRLKQIMLNLLSNAVKFTPNGGNVAISAERAGSHVILRVEDSGIGMSEEQTRKVMQPFYQVDNTITRHLRGTGLGLPLTKSLVELHGGRLEITSQPGRGTTVTVYLRQA